MTNDLSLSDLLNTCRNELLLGKVLQRAGLQYCRLFTLKEKH